MGVQMAGITEGANDQPAKKIKLARGGRRVYKYIRIDT